MNGAQTLFDALRSAHRKVDGIKTEPAPTLFQTHMAAEQLARRAAIMGMSPEMIDRSIRRGIHMVGIAEEWCETPIEKRLLPWLVFADYGDEFLSIPAGVHSPRNQDAMPDDDILIVPQFAFAKYRMDFAIIARRDSVTRIVCVECDGQAYHAEAPDGRRDGYLLAYGIPTVRVSGKEITANPGGALARVIEAVRSVMGS